LFRVYGIGFADCLLIPHGRAPAGVGFRVCGFRFGVSFGFAVSGLGVSFGFADATGS
jgi:hypothetical protein